MTRKVQLLSALLTLAMAPLGTAATAAESGTDPLGNPTYSESEPAAQPQAPAPEEQPYTAPETTDPSVGTPEAMAPFRQQLSPYGEWINLPGVGWVWKPYASAVGSDFYPYGTGGQWVYSDYGWYFQSAYPWGWAPFHYGRWFFRPAFGWAWIPGRAWAPAWVSWRLGGGFIGWAPLGFGRVAYTPRWCFVESRHFAHPNVYSYAVPAYRFHSAYAVTAAVPAMRVGRGAHWYAGPPVAHVSAAVGRPIAPIRLSAPGGGVRGPGYYPSGHGVAAPPGHGVAPAPGHGWGHPRSSISTPIRSSPMAMSRAPSPGFGMSHSFSSAPQMHASRGFSGGGFSGGGHAVARGRR